MFKQLKSYLNIRICGLNSRHNSYKKVVIIFLASKLVLAVSILWATQLCNISFGEILRECSNYIDGGHYIFLAKHGYGSSLASAEGVPGDMLYAFFPLYPLLIKGLAFFIGNYEVSAILISNICYLLCGVLLVKFVDKKNRDWVLLLFYFSVNNVFFSLVYTESLYIFLTLLTYYFLLKRNNYYMTGVLLGLCVATRNTGCFLFAAIFIELCWNKSKLSTIMKVFIPASIISILYPFYNYIKAGNLLEFMSCQRFWCNRNSFPFHGLIEDIVNLLSGRKNDFFTPFLAIVSYIVIITSLILCIKKRLPRVWTLYLGISILGLSCYMKQDIKMSAVSSTFRYIYAIFPIYLVMADAFSRRYKRIIFVLHLVLGHLVAIAYFSASRGIFVA